MENEWESIGRTLGFVIDSHSLVQGERQDVSPVLVLEFQAAGNSDFLLSWSFPSIGAPWPDEFVFWPGVDDEEELEQIKLSPERVIPMPGNRYE